VDESNRLDHHLRSALEDMVGEEMAEEEIFHPRSVRKERESLQSIFNS
jgi:hypothetical protein